MQDETGDRLAKERADAMALLRKAVRNPNHVLPNDVIYQGSDLQSPPSQEESAAKLAEIRSKRAMKESEVRETRYVRHHPQHLSLPLSL